MVSETPHLTIPKVPQAEDTKKSTFNRRFTYPLRVGLNRMWPCHDHFLKQEYSPTECVDHYSSTHYDQPRKVSDGVRTTPPPEGPTEGGTDTLTASRERLVQTAVHRHKTALKRIDLSRPVRLAIQDGFITGQTKVFDYGCGRGDDLKLLGERGIPCTGWDPAYRPNTSLQAADVVNLGYVVNVIEDLQEREGVLKKAWGLADKLLVVTAQLDIDRGEGVISPLSDGGLTRIGTFQKYFAQSELRDWINSTLGVMSVAAAPGVFYAFRDEITREGFLASRYRRRSVTPKLRMSDRLFDEHKPLFEALMAFLSKRGRLPETDELAEAEEISKAIGSIRQAFAIVRRVTGAESWEEIAEERGQDLLIYLALSRFDERPKFKDLPKDIRYDVRALYSTYTRACEQADALLYRVGNPEMVDQACRQATVGKITPTAIYIHRSALSELPPILRLFEGCARGYIGEVEEANIIKLYRAEPKVSYLSYPQFDKDPHPALYRSLSVNLRSFKIKYLRYSDIDNPPILHRKEEFVGNEYPKRVTFSRLTKQEEERGLFEDTKRIGTVRDWNRNLEDCGYEIRGHRLVHRNSGIS